MTLTRFSGAYEELFKNCVIWWTGRDQTITGFPIIPNDVTVTPAGTFANDLNLGNNTLIKTFDGSTNYLSLTDNDAWVFYNSDFTISGWLRPINSTNVMYFFIQRPSSTLYMAIGYDPSSHRIQLFFLLPNDTCCVSYYSSQALSFDTLYHIVIQRSGSNTYMYLNGNPITVVKEYAWAAIPNMSAPLLIGKNGTTAYSKCNIKDLMLFTRVLSQSEIITVMRKTNPVSGQDNFYPTLSGIRGVE